MESSDSKTERQWTNRQIESNILKWPTVKLTRIKRNVNKRQKERQVYKGVELQRQKEKVKET